MRQISRFMRLKAYIDGTEEGEEPVCDFGTVTPSDETQSQMMFVDIKNTGTGTLNFKSISPEHFMVADIEEPLVAGESVSVSIQAREILLRQVLMTIPSPMRQKKAQKFRSRPRQW